MRAGTTRRFRSRTTENGASTSPDATANMQLAPLDSNSDGCPDACEPSAYGCAWAEPEEPEAPLTFPEIDAAKANGIAMSMETPGEQLNIRMAGVQRDYPVYYNNILYQMARCFRPTARADDLRTRIYFVINRDGSVSGVDILEPSGSIAFDIEAMGAAECIGRPGRLGPLPDELPFDRFPVVFYFEPQSGRDADSGK